MLSGCIIFGKRRNRGRSLKSSAEEREQSKWLKQRGRKEHFGITPPFYVISFSRRQADQSSSWLIFDQIDIGWWNITINSPYYICLKIILQFKFKCKQRPHDYTHEYLWISIIETHFGYMQFSFTFTSFYSECSWHYSSTREPELMKCSHRTAPLQEIIETGSQHRVTATCFTSLTLSWISSSGVHVPSGLAPI